MKKFFSSLLTLIICLTVGFAVLKIKFPDLRMPLIVNSIGEVEESSLGSPYKTYFFNLSNIEKQAYNLILNEIYNMPEQILIPNLSEEELDNVFSALLNDNPDLFFIGRRCIMKTELWNVFISFDYIMTPEEYAQSKRQLEEKRDIMLATCVYSGDEFRTELAIHDYIIRRCEYMIEDNEYIYSSSYGCLVNNQAACEGYSKAAKYIFDAAGIESMVVSGKATSSDGVAGEHMWNIVKINGEWYHLDCTWDDPVKEDGSMIMYTYFNVNDESIKKNHSDFSYNPGCTATADNYYKRKNLCFENYSTNYETQLANAILEQYNSGVREITIDFMNEASYKAAINSLIDNRRIFRVLEKTGSSSGKKLSEKMTGYIPDDEFYTLTFSFE